MIQRIQTQFRRLIRLLRDYRRNRRSDCCRRKCDYAGNSGGDGRIECNSGGLPEGVMFENGTIQGTRK